MKVLRLLLILTVIALLGSLNQANAQDNSTIKNAEVIGVFMHADWCMGCKKLKPKLKAVKPKFKDKPILFTGFEKTNAFTKQQSQMLASQLGLNQLFNKHKGRTGYMVLVDAQTKKELDILKYDMSTQELKRTILSAFNSQ